MADLQLPPYMTTPELRVGPPPPYTSTSLQINLFFRVFLGILANVACWVPMRLLWKNGEFSAAMFCLATMTLNFFYVINALIWRNDNVKDWFAGYGWCDLQMYTVFAVQTLYAACIFEIMRNLASKVAMMRATSLTSGEKRRRIMIEALIIFPFPMLQVIMTYFVLAQRYNVATLIGCTNLFYRSVPYLIVYHIPTNVFSILTVFYGCLTWFRFWQVEKATRTARGSISTGMHARHQRIRRKLFLMCLSIMVPFFPMQIFWLYVNIQAGLGSLRPYDFKKIHNPATFNLVTFMTSGGMSFLEMNGNYMAIITVVPIFWFFGFTKEAVNIYRVYCLRIGLGRFFPKLHEEYEPDRSRSSSALRSWGQNISGFLKSSSGSGTSRTKSADGSRKNSILPSFQHVSVATTTVSSTRSRNTDTINDEHISVAPPAKTDSNPWPDVKVPEPAARFDLHQSALNDDDALQIQHRNPFIFRTMLANPMRLFTHKKDKDRSASAPPHQVPLSEFGTVSHTRHPQSGSDTKSLVGIRIDSRDGDGVPHWTAVDSSAAVDGYRRSKGPSAKVQTRVWSEDEEHQLGAAATGKRRTRGQDRDMEVSEIGLAVSGGGSSGVRVETSIARSERKL